MGIYSKTERELRVVYTDEITEDGTREFTAKLRGDVGSFDAIIDAVVDSSVWNPVLSWLSQYGKLFMPFVASSEPKPAAAPVKPKAKKPAKKSKPRVKTEVWTVKPKIEVKSVVAKAKQPPPDKK